MKVISNKKCVIEFDATFLVLNSTQNLLKIFLRDNKQKSMFFKSLFEVKSLTKLLAIIIRSAKAIYLTKLEDGVKKSVSF